MAENQKGALWLTAMGRIVLDGHGYESFSEPGDKKLLSAELLNNGIKVKEFMSILIDALQEGSE